MTEVCAVPLLSSHVHFRVPISDDFVRPPPNDFITWLDFVNGPTKSVDSCDIQADALLSIPTGPESVSKYTSVVSLPFDACIATAWWASSCLWGGLSNPVAVWVLHLVCFQCFCLSIGAFLLSCCVVHVFHHPFVPLLLWVGMASFTWRQLIAVNNDMATLKA